MASRNGGNPCMGLNPMQTLGSTRRHMGHGMGLWFRFVVTFNVTSIECWKPGKIIVVRDIENPIHADAALARDAPLLLERAVCWNLMMNTVALRPCSLTNDFNNAAQHLRSRNDIK